MQTLDPQRVAELRGRAGAAHGVYEEGELGGVYDQQWPQWYAAYLVAHGLSDLVGRALTAAQVAAWLADCDAAYKAACPGIGWAAYYGATFPSQSRMVSAAGGIWICVSPLVTVTGKRGSRLRIRASI